MHYSSGTLKIRRSPSFSDIERRFLNSFPRKIAEEYLLKKEIWVVDHFQHLKEKISNLSTNAFKLGSHNCLPSIQMKILRTFFPENSFPFYHFWNLTGIFSDYAGKQWAWAKFSSILAKVFRLACQNWKLFVHLSSLKLLKSSENHRGTTWETFRNFRTFWNLVDHRARNFLPFDKKFRWEIQSWLSRRQRNYLRKTLFLRFFGTLTKSSLAF